jgi:hypothetical protein
MPDHRTHPLVRDPTLYLPRSTSLFGAASNPPRSPAGSVISASRRLRRKVLISSCAIAMLRWPASSPTKSERESWRTCGERLCSMGTHRDATLLLRAPR